MKTIVSLIGIILIIFGIASLGYNGFKYTTREKVAEIGNLQLTADTEKQVYISPVVGGLALAVGVVLVFIGRVGRD